MACYMKLLRLHEQSVIRRIKKGSGITLGSYTMNLAPPSEKFSISKTFYNFWEYILCKRALR